MKLLWITLVVGAALLSGCASVSVDDGCGSKNLLQREAGGSRPVHHDIAF